MPLGPSRPGVAFTAAAIFALALAPHATAQRSAELLGRWKGGLVQNGTTTELTLEFFRNGTYARRVVLSSEFGWTVSGDVLLLAPAIASRDNEITYGMPSAVHMKVANDVLVITDSSKSISLKRVTVPINESEILGRWEGQSELNEGITQDFLADGRLIVTVTLAREAGRYSVRDNSINWEVQIPLPRRTKSRIRLEGEKLTLYLSKDLPAIELTRVAADSTAR